MPRVYVSPPHMPGHELEPVKDAFVRGPGGRGRPPSGFSGGAGAPQVACCEFVVRMG